MPKEEEPKKLAWEKSAQKKQKKEKERASHQWLGEKNHSEEEKSRPRCPYQQEEKEGERDKGGERRGEGVGGVRPSEGGEDRVRGPFVCIGSQERRDEDLSLGSLTGLRDNGKIVKRGKGNSRWERGNTSEDLPPLRRRGNRWKTEKRRRLRKNYLLEKKRKDSRGEEFPTYEKKIFKERKAKGERGYFSENC